MQNVTTADILNAETNNGWESDREIVQAILEFAVSHDEAQRVWEGPTQSEKNHIIARAWELASDDTETLYWGQEEITR